MFYLVIQSFWGKMKANTNFSTIVTHTGGTDKKQLDEKNTVAFCGVSQDVGSDSFVKSNSEKKKTVFEVALAGVAAFSVAAIGITRHKLGKILSSVGAEIPKTTFSRLNKLSDITTKDGMTGLLNKNSLVTALKKEVTNAANNSQDYGVGMLDMDNFKGINEIFSHDTGDTFLKRIAANIDEVASKYSARGFRYGGEEFAVLMPGKDSNTAQKIIKEIAEAIKNDDEIQKMLPKFVENASEQSAYIGPSLKQIDRIFSSVRSGFKGTTPEVVSGEVVSLIENHIRRFKPAESDALNSIVKILKTATPGDLKSLLKADAVYSDGVVLGPELNKIYTQYSSINNDLKKWLSHIKQHNNFTMSGGVVGIKDVPDQKDGQMFLKYADAALKAAKENGKNIIQKANSDIISNLG